MDMVNVYYTQPLPVILIPQLPNKKLFSCHIFLKSVTNYNRDPKKQ